MTQLLIILLEVLRRALSKGAAVPSARREPHSAWAIQAESALHQEKHGRVLEIVEARMAKGADALSDQDAASCAKFLGMMSFARARHREALGLFRTAQALGSPDFDVLVFLAYALLRLDRAEEARLHLEGCSRLPLDEWEKEALRDFLENIRFLMSKGELDAAKCILAQERQMGVLSFLRAGRMDLARKALNRALMEDFDDFQAHNNLGLLEWMLGNHEKALSCFRNCLAINPEWSDALANAQRAALSLGLSPLGVRRGVPIQVGA